MLGLVSVLDWIVSNQDKKKTQNLATSCLTMFFDSYSDMLLYFEFVFFFNFVKKKDDKGEKERCVYVEATSI